MVKIIAPKSIELIDVKNECDRALDVGVMLVNNEFVAIKKVRLSKPNMETYFVDYYTLSGSWVCERYSHNIYKVTRSNPFNAEECIHPEEHYSKEHNINVGNLFGYYGKHQLL